MANDDRQGKRGDYEQDSQRQTEPTGQRSAGNEGRSQMGAGSVSTEDRASCSPGGSQAPPEQVVSFQTTQLPSPPPDYPVASGGDVVEEQQRKHRDRDNDEHRQRKRKKRHEPSSSMPDWKTLAVTAVLALVFGVGGAWGYSALFGSLKSDEQSGDSDKGGKSGEGLAGRKSGGNSGGDKEKNKGSSSSSGGASASEIPGFSSAQDAETFKKQLEHLAHRLDLLGGRIDNLTTNKDKTPPVLHTMQTKMTDLEREVDEVANLPAKFSRLERKLSDMEQEFKTLKERVSGAETPIATDLSPSGLDFAKAELPAADADPADEATLNLAAGLLREGHYSQSYEVLRRLQRERPNDARIWYLSALANGLATGNWDGKTKQLAEKGIACERSGRPSQTDIDETLSGIDSAKAMSWMAKLREDVKTR